MGDEIPFKSTMNFTYGEPCGMAPGVSRLVASNPGPFTFKGTNTYLVGSLSLAVIDPGPDDEDHTKAILKAAAGRPITHIIVTHAHRDHVDGVTRLQAATNAQTVGFGRSQLDTPEVIAGPTGEAFVDARFNPDLALAHGDNVSGQDWALEAIHTPGHAPDHLCFSLAGTGLVFCGDHVMGWNTTVIAPPEGSMADYMASLELLLCRPATLYLPGHGGRVEDPVRLVRAFLIHRRWRERAIEDAIAAGTNTIFDIVSRIYQKLDDRLRMAASLSVQAHVEHLIARGKVTADTPLEMDSILHATRGSTNT